MIYSCHGEKQTHSCEMVAHISCHALDSFSLCCCTLTGERADVILQKKKQMFVNEIWFVYTHTYKLLYSTKVPYTAKLAWFSLNHKTFPANYGLGE